MARDLWIVEWPPSDVSSGRVCIGPVDGDPDRL